MTEISAPANGRAGMPNGFKFLRRAKDELLDSLTTDSRFRDYDEQALLKREIQHRRNRLADIT